jgi:DUF4097 and DUF4098 domain-containing protein YvlB
MSPPRRAGSVFWGIILVATGLIFLMKNLGYPIAIWTGIARYWPILLIVWGAVKLVDYARWKRAGEPGPLFGAGEVVLLIIVILSGTALTAAANMSPDIGNLFEMANIDLWDITGNSYQFSEHYEKDVPSGSSIEIINRYGFIEVMPAETDRILVDVAKTVIAANQAAADDLSKVLTYSIAQEGDRYRVISTFNRDQNSVRGRRFKTALTVKVPRRSNLTINNRNGSVSVSGLTGDQRITNAFGNVTLSEIAGPINIMNRNADVSVKEITGAATISNEFGSTEVKTVSGSLELRHRNGSVDVEGVKGDAKISNAFGSLKADDIHGTLNIDARMTSVEVSRVEGDVTVENQFQSVNLDGASGSVNIENRNGSVDIRYEQPPRKNIRVTSRYGDVTLVLPRTSTFSIDARTRFGDVSSDFPELSRQSDRERNSFSGQVGSGGPEIRIENTNGSIHIER